MKSNVGHLQININPQNFAFYKDLLAFMDWKVIYEDGDTLGMCSEEGPSLWFSPATKEQPNHYDGIGMNHLGIAVGEEADVDRAVTYLQEHNIPALFGTPRRRDDFVSDPQHVYYQVMFETPDKVLVEIVYTGLKQ
ncbi:MAG TPA: VOC family protein [Anaerolineaceae bacterium]|nr:VOC family protein [Anaerolineaceae bacterium]